MLRLRVPVVGLAGLDAALRSGWVDRWLLWLDGLRSGANLGWVRLVFGPVPLRLRRASRRLWLAWRGRLVGSGSVLGNGRFSPLRTRPLPSGLLGRLLTGEQAGNLLRRIRLPQV